MKSLTKLLGAGAGLSALAALPARAQDAVAPIAEASAVVSGLDTGDTAWMLVSTLLVLFMILPGVALFYGGLVRSKNVLSILMQCTVITGVVMIIYVLYGYSLAFGGSTSAFWGGLDKVFLSGVTAESESGTIPSCSSSASR